MTDVWTSIVKNLEGKLDSKELKTWFAPTRQISLHQAGGSSPVLTIGVPNRVFADWIERRHADLLAREAAAAGLPDLTIRFEAEPADELSREPAPAPTHPASLGYALKRASGR